MQTRLGHSIFDVLSPLVFRVLDFLIVLLSFVLAHYVRYGHIDVRFEYQMMIIISCFIVVGAVSVFGNYQSWRGKSQLELAGRIFLSWFIAFVTLFALLAMTKRGEDFSRLWIGYTFVFSCVLAIVFRVTLYALLGFLRGKGFNQRQVLLIGQGDFVTSLYENINSDLSSGFYVTTALDLKLQGIPQSNMSFANLEDMVAYAEKNLIREVWVCLSLRDAQFLDELLFAFRHSTANIRFVPDMSGFRLLNHKVSYMAGVSTLDLSSSPLDGFNGLLKRVEDIVIALGIIILVLPFSIPIAIAVRLSGPGPIIFKQLRLGADGKPINIYKFRSMKTHVDSEVKQAVKDDDRVTKVGAFLRRTSLDELPQFYNVLQGRMSVVGPRPHAISHNEHYKELVESYMQRHRVKPGITGWAQVNGLRGETRTLDKMEKRVELDLYYIDNWSLVFDIKIILLTVFKIFSDENAY